METWKTVKQLIHAFTTLYPDAEWGWAHVVVSDFNLEDDYILSSFERYDALTRKSPTDEATALLLKLLLLIPEDDRCPPEMD